MSGDLRLDDVEVKITLDRDQIDLAMLRLELPPDRPEWGIYFLEDVTEAVEPGTPLLDLGLVLRARHKPDEPDDTTVKLRPCRRSQLPARWLAAEKEDDWELKVEADWAGSRHKLAVSCTADRRSDRVREVARGEREVTALFHDKQIEFIQECWADTVNLAALTMLPRVTAMRWKKAGSAPDDLKVRAERWTVDHLDFLELSVVAPIEHALDQQRALTEYVHSLGLTIDENQEAKTRRVIDHLVEKAVSAAE